MMNCRIVGNLVPLGGYVTVSQEIRYRCKGNDTNRCGDRETTCRS